MEMENNYIINSKRYQAQMNLLSEKFRLSHHEKRETSQSHLHSNSNGSNDNEYKIDLHSGHLEPILDVQSQEIEDLDAIIANVELHDKCETLKTENANLKQIIIELNRTNAGNEQKYDDLKAKYDLIIGLTRFHSEWKDDSRITISDIYHLRHIIIEDVVNSYIMKADETRFFEQVNSDLVAKLAEYDGLLAVTEKQREEIIKMTEKLKAYKQKVSIWKKHANQTQKYMKPYQNLQVHVRILHNQNQIQAQKILELEQELQHYKR